MDVLKKIKLENPKLWELMFQKESSSEEFEEPITLKQYSDMLGYKGYQISVEKIMNLTCNRTEKLMLAAILACCDYAKEAYELCPNPWKKIVLLDTRNVKLFNGILSYWDERKSGPKPGPYGPVSKGGSFNLNLPQDVNDALLMYVEENEKTTKTGVTVEALAEKLNVPKRY